MGERSGSSADSYIGSLISLTSKSEIRYEGILYTIDTDNSNIALQDVRSFGTEGRKKDGPQIPPSDKVYDYIIFRGSDIKDLQVKSSPPAQTASQLHSDPAIISLQSQHSRPASVSAQFGPSGGGPLSDMSSQDPYSGVVPSPFPGGMPSMYPAGANLGSWGHPPSSPGANGMGLGMPMYWQGYYRPPAGLPHLPQQPVPFHQHPGVPSPLTQQEQVQQNTVNLSSPMPASLAFNSPLHQPVNILSDSSSSSVFSTSMPVDISTSSTITIDSGSKQSSLPVSTASSTSITTASSKQEVSVVLTPASSKPRIISGSTSSSQSMSQSASSHGVQTSFSLPTSDAPTLVTPGQLLQPVSITSSSSSSLSISQLSTESLKVSQPLIPRPHMSSESLKVSQPLIPRPPILQPQAAQSQQPLLPLPTSSSQQKVNQQMSVPGGNSGANRRGRGRARSGGISHGAVQFTEDFDFIGMNEKFNKDEVWGQLGKGESKDKLENGEEEEPVNENAEEDGTLGQSSRSVPDSSRKPVYSKDDFFDSLSCDALDRGGRSRFSEQRKIDTQTFGSSSLRSHMGRGGRNSGYRGSFRGSYYGGRGNGFGGRGNGYAGRGHGGG
ncbi:hypothetical protein SUGI_0400480 [Cryptomeria japonica]|uniref:protein decapping 5 n=1 Tax=Cryptomeria japonica TaxID=3369 RepID=UPI002408A243|nr:protein decapping 5 [Cryptomeria japonica]XP_057817691.2 protein decapping 5 [Cryptomeria japonica]GLJ21576.1 hypothetical protein SUGI_0400480 [Cryptomeria japonica]